MTRTDPLAWFEAALHALNRFQCGADLNLVGARDACLELLQMDVELIRHPLGFHHIELTTLIHPPRGQDRVRLHFHPRDYGRYAYSKSHAHSHRWLLKSCVLIGALTNEVYRFSPNPEGQLVEGRVRYGDPRKDHVDASERRGVLELESEEFVPRGRIYCQGVDILHRTRPETEPLVTLLMARNVQEEAKVILPLDAEDEVRGRRTATLAERASLIAGLRELST